MDQTTQYRQGRHDVGCSTERKGSPHVLVCTKNQASHERSRAAPVVHLMLRHTHPSVQASRPGRSFTATEAAHTPSQDFRDVLTECGFTASMSRCGNCWDNACSETLFGSLKVKRRHAQRFVTRRQAKGEVIAWLLWYNQTRLHSTLAQVGPNRFEQDGLSAQAKQGRS